MDTKTALRMERVCLGILQDARNELYLNMRFLDLALSGLTPVISTDLEGIGTDGRILCAHPYVLAGLYEQNRLRVNRVYLHCVFHCLFRHLFKRPGRDRELWHLACDIAVESVIDTLRARSVRTGISVLRRNWYERLRAELPVLTPEGIYHVLKADGLTPSVQKKLADDFCIDDHGLWPELPEDEDTPPPDALAVIRARWQEIGEKTQTQMESFSSEEAEGAEEMLSSLRCELREKGHYRDFLRRFAVLREEMRQDTDAFDYIYYTFGLNLYGNMPLIEHPESRESVRIEEFVVVLDVSMSTRGELIRQFLEDTYRVLSESESYFRKVHIRILQCDEKIREDVKITDAAQMQAYMDSFSLKGGGGTDFRPAFAYVRKLVDEKAFSHLRGMLYFTDGLGTYPAGRPPWDTAFVFTDRQKDIPEVPPWAMRIVLPSYPLERGETGNEH